MLGWCLLSAGCLLLFPGCDSVGSAHYGKYVPFTPKLIEQYALSTDDIRHIQFYVSRQILLHRELVRGEANVVKGKLVVKDGKSIDEVEVVELAPGVATDVTLDRRSDDATFDNIDVRFEANAPVISFAAFADKPEDNFSVSYDTENKNVAFDGLEYKAMGSSLSAILLIDKDALGSLESKRRVLKGLRLPDSQ
jgi:hypothetical protein